MLVFDPTKRISVEEALNHPYLAELHFPDDEPTTEPVSAFDFDFEIYDLKGPDYKDLLYEETMLYHSEEKRQEYESNKLKYPEGILN
jgi:serine/threonine protein kinase